MIDLALVCDPDKGAWDLSFDGADLSTEAGLGTAVVLSLFDDARAKPDDASPGGDPRGWWADKMSPTPRPTDPTDRHGSRLWLLSREKRIEATRIRVETYAAEALRWLVEDGWASAVTVKAAFPRERPGWCVFRVDLTKPDGAAVSITHDARWGV